MQKQILLKADRQLRSVLAANAHWSQANRQVFVDMQLPSRTMCNSSPFVYIKWSISPMHYIIKTHRQKALDDGVAPSVIHVFAWYNSCAYVIVLAIMPCLNLDRNPIRDNLIFWLIVVTVSKFIHWCSLKGAIGDMRSEILKRKQHFYS